MAALFGASADERASGYWLRVPRSVRVELGQQSVVSLTIAPERGYSISHDGPVSLRASSPSDGLRLARARYSRKDAVDPLADAPRFELGLRGGQPGQYDVAIDVSFWLCRRRTCKPVQRSLTLTATVPAADPGVQADAGPPVDAR